MLLAIDTSTRYAGVCLRSQERVLCSLTWHSTQNHTRELLPAIQSLLGRAEGGMAAVQAIAVAAGPGGFSSLRVGMSVAKGLAMPTGLPLVSVGTLECEAFPYASTRLPICPLLDVGRGEVATALFQQKDTWQRIAEEQVSTPNDLASLFNGAPDVKAVVCGEGVAGHEDAIRGALGEGALVVGGGVASRLASLADLGWQRWTAGQTEDLATLQPFYLRRPTIGRPATPRPVRS